MINANKHLWNARRFGVTPRYLAVRLLGSPAPNGCFMTSQPKSGTHLLERILCLVPGIYRPIMRTINEHNIEKYGGWNKVISRARPGQLIVSHAHYDVGLADILKSFECKSFVMVRDPRAMVVSHVHFVQRRKDHKLHAHLDGLPFSEAINLICSGDTSESQAFLLNMKNFIGWANHSEFKVVKFEDLLGESKIEELGRIISHIGLDISASKLEELSLKMFSSASPTFRSGRIDEWKEVLTPAQISKIEKRAEDAMNAFGYS